MEWTVAERPQLTTAEVVTRVERLLARSVTGIEPVPGSVTNQDFAITLAGEGQALVKIGDPRQLAAEAWALGQVSAAGLRVQSVLAVDAWESGSLLVLGWIEGEPSTDPAVLVEAGRVMAGVHRIELPGYGSLTVDEAGRASGRADSWAQFVAAQVEDVTELVRAGLITIAVAGGVRREADRLRLGSWEGIGVLLHGDLKAAHILADGERLAGLIDWGDPMVGDPRYDLARLSMMGGPALDAFALGYGIEVTGALREVLAGYRVVWNISSLAYEYRAGGDWFDAYRDRVLADLEWLDRSGP